MEIRNKLGQSEVITTVLLILISIAAVVLVSTFIINLVRNNLGGTDCFQTTGQFEIRTNEGFTFFNTTDNSIYMSVARGIKDFNLSGITITFGDDRNSDSKKIKRDASDPFIFYYNSTGGWDNQSIKIPEPGQTRAYKLNISSSGIIPNKLTIYPVLQTGTQCDKADEKTISSAS